MDDDAGAGCGKRAGGSAADAARGAGNQRGSAGEGTHGGSPWGLFELFDLADYAAVLPPLTLMIWPVMNEALAELANTIASAISSGLPARFSGTPATSPAFRSELPVKRSSIAVSIGPGATALTRTPNAAASSAADLVRPSTACLLAV